MHKGKIMTKDEILKKANSFKLEYNICNQNVSQYHQTLNFYNRYKDFFAVRAKKTKHIKNNLLVSSINASIIFGLMCFISIFAAIPAFVLSVLSWERFFFFNMVNKKFKRSEAMFERLSKKVGEKESCCINKKENIMAQIIALEKEIPDEIKETILIIDEPTLEETDNVQTEILTI